MNIANISIKQPVFVMMMMLVLVVVGIIGYSRLSVDLFPSTSNPSVSVSTSYAGAGPQEVQEQGYPAFGGCPEHPPRGDQPSFDFARK